MCCGRAPRPGRARRRRPCRGSNRPRRAERPRAAAPALAPVAAGRRAPARAQRRSRRNEQTAWTSIDDPTRSTRSPGWQRRTRDEVRILLLLVERQRDRKAARRAIMSEQSSANGPAPEIPDEPPLDTPRVLAEEALAIDPEIGDPLLIGLAGAAEPRRAHPPGLGVAGHAADVDDCATSAAEQHRLYQALGRLDRAALCLSGGGMRRARPRSRPCGAAATSAAGCPPGATARPSRRCATISSAARADPMTSRTRSAGCAPTATI